MRSITLRTAAYLFFAVCLIGWGGVEPAGAVGNTAYGDGALHSITTGSENTAVGYQALYSNTTGWSNTADGYQALYSNIGGNYNSADGYKALYSNTNGSYNTADGPWALYSNTTGNYNSAVGNQALYSNIGGNYNTAAGGWALYFNTSGNYNTASGVGALYNNNIGSHNTADGNDALYYNTSGAQNTAVGDGALFSNTTGKANTAEGYEALYSNGIGKYNTAVGHGALFSNTAGSYNTALGYKAGRLGAGLILSGENNIYIGANVMPATQTESDTIRIGKAQTKTFIAGVHGRTASGGTEVFVNSYGRLGTTLSSRRYKEAIEDMGEASSGLMKLRPVTFRYKPEYADGPSATQYGLVAEEVAEVYPDLVQYDPKTGEPQTVHYRLVNAMLLNEVQKQRKEISSLREGLKELSGARERQEAELSALKEQLRQLTSLMAQNTELPGFLSKLETRSER